MKQCFIMLTLSALCFSNLAFAMRGTIPQKLQFTHYKTLSNGDQVGWLYVPGYNDSVLINLGKNSSPHIDGHGKSNYKYISPAVPSQRLPKGLFFWKSTDSNPEIGNHNIKFMVYNQPPTGTHTPYKAGFYYHKISPGVERYGYEHTGQSVEEYQGWAHVKYRSHPF